MTVPPVVAGGDTVRVHLTFRPNLKTKAHWNNEVDALVFWVNPSEGWSVNHRASAVANAPALVSQEARGVEFELTVPSSQPTGTVKVPGYALYYVCEDVNGVCMYRRHDVDVPIRVVAGPKRNQP